MEAENGLSYSNTDPRSRQCSEQSDGPAPDTAVTTEPWEERPLAGALRALEPASCHSPVNPPHLCSFFLSCSVTFPYCYNLRSFSEVSPAVPGAPLPSHTLTGVTVSAVMACMWTQRCQAVGMS